MYRLKFKSRTNVWQRQLCRHCAGNVFQLEESKQSLCDHCMFNIRKLICTQWHRYFGCGTRQTHWTKYKTKRKRKYNCRVKDLRGEKSTLQIFVNKNRCFRNGICCVASSNEEILQSSPGITKRPNDLSSINSKHCKF